MRKALLGIVIVLLFALPLSGCGLTQDFQAVQKVTENFMTALKDGDYAGAYALFSNDLQQEVGSADNLQTLAQDNGVLPVTWTFTNTKIATEGGSPTGVVQGTVTYQDGGEGTLYVHMTKVEAVTTVWIIDGFNLTR